MMRNVYSSAVFVGGRPLCTQILPRQGRLPSTILGTRKLETLGYLMKTASVCIPSFWYNTRVWRTDGRIRRSIFSACKASFAVRCKSSFWGQTSRSITIYHNLITSRVQPNNITTGLHQFLISSFSVIAPTYTRADADKNNTLLCCLDDVQGNSNSLARIWRRTSFIYQQSSLIVHCFSAVLLHGSLSLLSAWSEYPTNVLHFP